MIKKTKREREIVLCTNYSLWESPFWPFTLKQSPIIQVGETNGKIVQGLKLLSDGHVTQYTQDKLCNLKNKVIPIKWQQFSNTSCSRVLVNAFATFSRETTFSSLM